MLIAPPVAGQTHRAVSGESRQSPAEAFEQGQNAQERGDLNTAVRLYSIVIAAEPSLFQAYYQRGVALMDLGRANEAEADLKKVIELQPGFARAHRAMGLLLLDQGKTDEAKRSLSRAIELDGKLTGVRIYYASALIKSGDPAAAIAHLQTAIEMGESLLLAEALLGLALERTGKGDEALAAYSRVIERESTNHLAREGRARILERKGELSRAVEDYSIAYRQQPSPDLARHLAQLYRRAGQPQAAVQIFRTLIKDKPEDMALRIELARAMIENNQAEEAVKEIEPMLTAHPNSPGLLSLLGDLSSKDKPDAGASYYRRALEADPSDNDTRVKLGATLVRAQKYEEALPVLNEAITRSPDNHAAHANLATALFKLKQYPEAA
ncbi:MAG TPA: tetratricopeptide repeat protein, partial [Blastocatellia bacterium]|nr:tetratricopeptide repeat protein [Blastocatellia bacterium]